jgi:hypothetical protein
MSQGSTTYLVLQTKLPNALCKLLGEIFASVCLLQPGERDESRSQINGINILDEVQDDGFDLPVLVIV